MLGNISGRFTLEIPKRVFGGSTADGAEKLFTREGWDAPRVTLLFSTVIKERVRGWVVAAFLVSQVCGTPDWVRLMTPQTAIRCLAERQIFEVTY